MSISEKLIKIKEALPEQVTLVAVSKTKPISELLEAYHAGQRVFGENKVQEMESKWKEMPKDIEWHMIGHVQRNKVKYMAPFVSLVHAVDSLRLLKEIDKQAKKNNRIINCLIQVKIAKEDSKFGLSEIDTNSLFISEEYTSLQNIKIVGLMGMATFTENQEVVISEFKTLKRVFDTLQPNHDTLKILSMGMSGDYELAIAEGSTMVRIGSSIFGERNY